MDVKWINKLDRIYGVESVLLVDRDGLVIAEAGDSSERIAPHSAMMVKKLIERVGVETVEEWLWTQCETDDMIISVANMGLGILVLVMESDANLGLVRMEARNIRRTLEETFGRSPFATKGR